MTRDELQRLIELIVREMAARPERARARCTCHAVVEECCPDRLQGVIDAGAVRLGVRATPSLIEAEGMELVVHEIALPRTLAEHER